MQHTCTYNMKHTGGVSYYLCKNVFLCTRLNYRTSKKVLLKERICKNKSLLLFSHALGSFGIHAKRVRGKKGREKGKMGARCIAALNSGQDQMGYASQGGQCRKYSFEKGHAFPPRSNTVPHHATLSRDIYPQSADFVSPHKRPQFAFERFVRAYKIPPS